MSRKHATQICPDLFVGLTDTQRRAVVRNLAWSMPDEAEPSRAEVIDMVQYVAGTLSNAEYARRCSRRDARSAARR